MMRVKVPLRAVAAVIPAFVLCIAFLLGSTHLLKLYSNNVSYPAYAERAAPWERPFFYPLSPERQTKATRKPKTTAAAIPAAAAVKPPERAPSRPFSTRASRVPLDRRTMAHGTNR